MADAIVEALCACRWWLPVVMLLSMGPRLAVYTRLSSDRDGEQTSTHRQEAACIAFATARCWDVTRALEDVDLSAYQRGVIRPAYEELLGQVEVGVYDGVLVWKLDRLMRRPAEFERFWAACEKSGTFLASVTEPIDSSSEIGLAMVRILVTFSGMESTTKSLRLKSKHLEMAKQGRAPGGPTPFGYTPGLRSIVPREADLIREAAQQVIAGTSCTAIAEAWNAEGVRGRHGGPWGGPHVSRLLCSPLLVGDRSYHGEVVATDCWPAILDRLTAARVRDVIIHLQRRRSNKEPSYLLTGFLACGRCGALLGGRGSAGKRYYVCLPVACATLGEPSPLRWKMSLLPQFSRGARTATSTGIEPTRRGAGVG